MGDSVAIQIAGLVKAYRGQRVLDGVDLRVERGDIVALLGPDAYAAIAAALDGRIVHSDPSRLRHGVATDGSATHIRHLLDVADPGRDAVASFEVHRATLDDVFLALTGHPATAGPDVRPPLTVRAGQAEPTTRVKESVDV